MLVAWVGLPVAPVLPPVVVVSEALALQGQASLPVALDRVAHAVPLARAVLAAQILRSAQVLEAVRRRRGCH